MPVGFNIAPAPRENAVVRPPTKRGDELAGLLTEGWAKFFDEWLALTNLKPTRLFDVSRENQTASIAATDATDGDLPAGLYRVHYYMQVTRAASTSSSLQMELGWNTNSVAQLETFAAITGNTTGTHQSGTMFVRIDRNSPITYRTTYASTGAVTMAYAVYVTVEHVKTAA